MEAALREALVSGHYVEPAPSSGEHDLGPEWAEAELLKQEPVVRLVRDWCGEDAVTVFDETQALRAEVARLQGVVESTAQWLKTAGHPRMAASLVQQMHRPGSDDGS